MRWPLLGVLIALIALSAGCGSSGDRNRNRDLDKPRRSAAPQQPAGATG